MRLPETPHTLPKVRNMNRKRVSIVCHLEPEELNPWNKSLASSFGDVSSDVSPIHSRDGVVPRSPSGSDLGSPTNVNRVVRNILLAKNVIQKQSEAVAELQECGTGLAAELDECGPAWQDDYFTFLRRNIRSKSLTVLNAVLPGPRDEIVPSPVATSKAHQLVARTPMPPTAPRPDEVLKREWHFSPEKKVDYSALLSEQAMDLKKGQENHQKYNLVLKLVSGERDVQLAKFDEYTKEDEE